MSSKTDQGTKQEIQELRKEVAQLLKEVKEFREEQRMKGWNNFPVIQVSPEPVAWVSGHYANCQNCGLTYNTMQGHICNPGYVTTYKPGPTVGNMTPTKTGD